MMDLVLCQKHILAVRWVIGKYWEFFEGRFLSPCLNGNGSSLTVFLHVHLWTERQRRSVVEEVCWGFPEVNISAVCGNSLLPLEVALRLDLEAVRQLFLLQQLCTKAAEHLDKHGFGDCDHCEPSKMVEILVWLFILIFSGECDLVALTCPELFMILKGHQWGFSPPALI